jgi:peptide/nickel transport system permease protein
VIAVVVVGAKWIAPYDFMALDLRARLIPPVFMGGDWTHPLGTDELGRDVLSRLIVSIQISMVIAFLSTLIAAIVGVSLGFIAAYFRGRIEQVILMLIDAQAAMPFMIIALAVLAFLGSSLFLFTILMGFYGWERIARISRGLAISANERGYATAVRRSRGDAVPDLFTAHPAQHRLDVDRLADTELPGSDPARIRGLFLPRLWACNRR